MILRSDNASFEILITIAKQGNSCNEIKFLLEFPLQYPILNSPNIDKQDVIHFLFVLSKIIKFKHSAVIKRDCDLLTQNITRINVIYRDFLCNNG